MPKGEPFTRLCQNLNQSRLHSRADLHIHSNHSDGIWDPSCIPHLANHAGVSAISITDHDTLAAYAGLDMNNSPVQILPGVEITTCFQSRVLHLLAYFPTGTWINTEVFLKQNQETRKLRFKQMLAGLIQSKFLQEDGQLEQIRVQSESASHTMGSRHLAQILVNQKKARNISQAVWKYLKNMPERQADWPETDTAIATVKDSGGITFVAHPAESLDFESFKFLKNRGLDGIEVEYPDFTQRRKQKLAEHAKSLCLLHSGGSDCHGDGNRTIGMATISFLELEKIKACGNVNDVPSDIRQA